MSTISTETQPKPLISIGMAVYNEQLFLQKTLDCILSQDYDNFELIISDNCSNDKTSEICKEYAAKDKRIRYDRNQINIGASDNFAKVFKSAQGDYFVFVAGHDMWDARFLSGCLEVFLQDAEVVLCHPQAVWIDTDDRALGIINGVLETRGLDRISRFQSVLWGLTYGYPVYGMIRTSALKQVTLGLKVIAPDNILLCELSLIGSFSYLPVPLLFMRILEDHGSWDSYVEKIFNRSLSEMSATELFWQMIYQYTQIIHKHVNEESEKDALLSLLPICLLTKYGWILNGLSETNSHIQPGPNNSKFQERISDLVNTIRESTSEVKTLLTECSADEEPTSRIQVSRQISSKIISELERTQSELHDLRTELNAMKNSRS